MQTRGVNSEANYPYKQTTGTCSPPNLAKTYNISYSWLSTNEEEMIYHLLNQGPIVFYMWIPQSFLYLSGTGVYIPTTDECNNNVSGHAMAIVGYGTENGVPYWLVKNSWGTWWGDQGYYKHYRGANLCFMGSNTWAASVV